MGLRNWLCGLNPDSAQLYVKTAEGTVADTVNTALQAEQREQDGTQTLRSAER